MSEGKKRLIIADREDLAVEKQKICQEKPQKRKKFHRMEIEMNTIRLFDQDSGRKEFQGEVLACEPAEAGYKILLDQTAFFPEGGGQTADTGTLFVAEKEAVFVKDVQEEQGLIYHYTEQPVQPGTKVSGILDWEERFSKMQHHSGEHIVSGLINRHFGYNNVGFHLGSQVVTLDFDGTLTKEQLRQVEREANEAVAANLPILVTYPSREELEKISYRSKIEIEGQVRIVEIPGYDVCACCAPHVAVTGQIGMIKLINMHHYKSGVRVYMLCGFAALADYCEKEDSVQEIALSMSTKENQVVQAVERLKEEIYRQKGQIMALTDALLNYKVAAVPAGTQKAVMVEAELEGSQPRELVNKLLERQVKVAVIFAGNEENGYRYVIGSREEDTRAIAKEMNGVLHGRGGGKPEMVQGTVACSREEIAAYFGEIL